VDGILDEKAWNKFMKIAFAQTWRHKLCRFLSRFKKKKERKIQFINEPCIVCRTWEGPEEEIRPLCSHHRSLKGVMELQDTLNQLHNRALRRELNRQPKCRLCSSPTQEVGGVCLQCKQEEPHPARPGKTPEEE
jgi:hypothetical protein